jgi:miniconductance mechanosensitive channel
MIPYCLIDSARLSITEIWNTTSELRLTIFIAMSLLVLYSVDLICRKLIVPSVERISKRTKSKWDDILFSRNVLTDISRVITPLVMLTALPHMFDKSGDIFFWCNKVINIYLVAVIVRLAFSAINALYQLSSHNNRTRSSAIKGIFQMFKIIAVCIGTIIIASIAIDKNPTHILTGLGAMAAVLMLVFQDTIKGLVAGVQLSANDMLRPGDWISLPKHDADGEVIEVTLTAVKVQNWDKTITTIPPYALLSESFQNWRGMFDSGGRRIKRSIYIDMNSISFCTPEQTEKFRNNGWLEGMDEHEEPFVNLTVLRNYLDIYLRNNKHVNQGMTLMVRQLQPTAQGLPLELYFFSANTAWIAYEHLQADIFEHVIAMLPEFGIKAFQTPSGADLNIFAAKNS